MFEKYVQTIGVVISTFFICFPNFYLLSDIHNVVIECVVYAYLYVMNASCV